MHIDHSKSFKIEKKKFHSMKGISYLTHNLKLSQYHRGIKHAGKHTALKVQHDDHNSWQILQWKSKELNGCYRCEGDVDAGLHLPGDLWIALPLPSDTEEQEAAVDCLFSWQHSSDFTTSAISFTQEPKILIKKP